MWHGLNNEFLYAAHRITAHFDRQTDKKSNTKNGTCFFVMNKRAKLCLITNRHMLDFGYPDNKQDHIGYQLSCIEIERFERNPETDKLPTNRFVDKAISIENSIRYSRLYEEDVACIVDPKVRTAKDANASIDFHISYDLVATKEWLDSKLSVCDFVAFPGFPTWYDKSTYRPIMRAGTIASDPRSDYSPSGQSEGRKVAFEAFSSSGSSGSPVFAAEKGPKPGPGLHFDGYREPKLIGVNAGHLQAEFGNHSGISYFFKASVILELIE